MRTIVLGGIVFGLCGVFAACSSSSDGGNTTSSAGASGAGASAGAAGSAGASVSAGAGGMVGAAGTRSVAGAAGERDDTNGGAAGVAGADDGASGAADCAPSDRGCDGLTPLSCQNGHLSPSGPACQFACHEGDCTGACALGALRCDGQVLETCGANNLWQDGTACAYVCDETLGCTGSCTPGTQKCASDTELDVCSARGTFEKTTCDLQCATVANKVECVECTSGDGLCPGGCTNPEDSDCAVDDIGHCPNIYLGLGRYKKPQPLDFANTSIQTANTMMKVGELQFIALSAYNHGSDDSPGVTLELLWGSQADGCSDNLHPLGSNNFAAISGTSLAPPVEGAAYTNMGFTPDATALATNGGHICLLARIYEDSAPANSSCPQQLNEGPTPAADPLTAVLNVQVVP